ncbi:hypothetical protein ACVWW5_002127 [Bradyrhizobium sp. LM3.4]
MLIDVAAPAIRTSAGLVEVSFWAWVASHIAAKRCTNLVTLAGFWKSARLDLARDQLGLGIDISRADRRRQAERRLDHLRHRLVREDLVGIGDGGGLAREIERQPQALVLVAGLLLHRLRDELGRDTGRSRGGLGRLVAEGGEIEGGGELPVAGVGQLVGEGFVVGDTLGQHLAHERLGVGHVAETKGLHRVGIEAIVLQEVVDGLHIADVAEEIVGVAADIRLRRDLRQRLAHVLGQSGVVRDGG